MTEEKKRDTQFWMGVLILVLVGVIIAMFIFKFIGKEFIILCLIGGGLYLAYWVINKLIIKVNIAKVINEIVKAELKDTGLRLDIGTIDNNPNCVVDRIGDEFLIWFKKEVLVYKYNSREGVYARVNDTLYNVKRELLESQYLLQEIMKRKEERVMEEMGEKIDATA